MIRWELNDDNAITREVSKRREESIRQFVTSAKKRLPLLLKGRDIEAFYTIISSALYFLTLKKDTISNTNGMDLTDEKTWVRLEKVIKQMIKGWLWG